MVLTVAVGFGVIGCGPPKLKREMPIRIGDQPSQGWGFDPQSVDQTFKVEPTTDNPVDLFVLVGTDENTALGMTPEELTQKATSMKRETTQETLTVKVPAKQVVSVMVRFGEKRLPASGKLKVSN
jgi:hypothetical protein